MIRTTLASTAVLALLAACSAPAPANPASSAATAATTPTAATTTIPTTPEPVVAPMSQDSLSRDLASQLTCDRRPEPTPLLIALHRSGHIVPAPDRVQDSVSCFSVRQPLSLPDGPRVVAVCAFDEDYRTTTAGTEYANLYSRGPGTSPGQVLTVVTAGTVAQAQAWARGRNMDEGVGFQPSDFRTGSDSEPAEVAEITCNRVR